MPSSSCTRRGGRVSRRPAMGLLDDYSNRADRCRLVFVTLRDIFQQLFRPHGKGSLSRFLMRSIWHAFCRFTARRPALLGLAGPSVLLAIISTWIILLVIGWAL